MLDPESATTLITMYDEIEEENARPMFQSRGYNYQDSPESRFSHREIHEESGYHRGTFESSKRAPPVEHVYCIEHPDELINYFCFQ